MTPSDWIAGISLVVAVAALLYTVISNTKKYELTYQYYQDVVAWHSDVIKVITQLKAINEECSKMVYLAELSALIETGRFYFPNIDQHDNLFFIKPTFLAEMTNDDYTAVFNRIDTYWGGFQTEQQRMIDEVQALIDRGTTEEKRTYVAEMLTTREAIKRGQAFEVTSFAVLNTYLYALGFSLNRFSTTYSNDGGIDFVAQNAIYQVTTKLSARKFDEDIKKVTGKERVLIYKDLTRDFDMEHLSHELVVNHIGKDELLGFLDYLIAKNADRFLPLILNVMKTEFLREFYQNDPQ